MKPRQSRGGQRGASRNFLPEGPPSGAQTGLLAETHGGRGPRRARRPAGRLVTEGFPAFACVAHDEPATHAFPSTEICILQKTCPVQQDLTVKDTAVTTAVCCCSAPAPRRNVPRRGDEGRPGSGGRTSLTAAVAARVLRPLRLRIPRRSCGRPSGFLCTTVLDA